MEGVIARTAVEQVRARAAGKRVIALATVKATDLRRRAVEDIVPVCASDVEVIEVLDIEADQRAVAQFYIATKSAARGVHPTEVDTRRRAPVRQRSGIIQHQAVGAYAAVDDVEAGAAADVIIAVTGQQNVGSRERVERVVARPGYLKTAGTPKTIADLEVHNRIGFNYARAVEGWPFKIEGETIVVSMVGRVQTSDGEALRRLALSGVGIARLAAFTVREDIEAGRLVSLLEPFDTGETEAFHAVYMGQGGPLPSRVRVLLDFLAENATVQ